MMNVSREPSTQGHRDLSLSTIGLLQGHAFALRLDQDFAFWIERAGRKKKKQKRLGRCFATS